MISIERAQRARSASSNARVVRGAAQSRGADDRDRVGAFGTRLVVQAADDRDRPRDRFERQHAGRVESFAEPGDLGPIGHGLGRTVGSAFPEEELDRVRADVDDGIPEHAEPDECLQAACHVGVRASGQPEPFDRRAHEGSVRRLDRDRADASARRLRSRFARPCTRRRRSGSAVCATAGSADLRSSRPTRRRTARACTSAGRATAPRRPTFPTPSRSAPPRAGTPP